MINACNFNEIRESHLRSIGQNPFSNRVALRLSLTISTILNAILLLGYFFNKNAEQYFLIRLIYMFLTNVIMFYVLYIFNFKVIQKKWTKQVKFMVTWLGTVLIAVVLNLIFIKVMYLMLVDLHIPKSFFFVTNMIKDLIVAIIVILSTILLYTSQERQHTLLENEKLIAENIRIRYEALKNQVDPHFLFNSLNTLDGLIDMDTDKAHEYVQNLSSVFRYTIGNKGIMHLDEELDFTESYAALMKIRYGDSLQIQYRIDKKYRRYYILPVSLQLLVENAIKHNVISSKHPLVITIETTPEDSIRVYNTIQPKTGSEPGEGIGLANLTERYNLLFQKDVLITRSETFCVEIPLIKHLEKLNS